MRSAIHIRRATPADAPALAHIQTEVWKSTYPNPALGITRDAIETHLTALNADGDERLRRVLSNPEGQTWVGCAGGEVVGFIGVRRTAEASVIEALHIAPGHQGRGIGPRLLEHALAWLGPASPIALDVVAYNTRAVRLYERYGFRRQDVAATDAIDLRAGIQIPLLRMVKAA